MNHLNYVDLNVDLVMIFKLNNTHFPNCRNILTYRHLKIWNKLSDDIVKSNSIISFKTKIISSDFRYTSFLNCNLEI